jgi:hypothetical protein
VNGFDAPEKLCDPFQPVYKIGREEVREMVVWLNEFVKGPPRNWL